jgi:hypothetical protein
MNKKQRRKARLLDLKFGFKTGTTEALFGKKEKLEKGTKK